MGIENKFFLVRHLRTDFNTSGINMGRVIDAEILSSGKEIEVFKGRIAAVSKAFSLDSRTVSIVSSPLKRCVQTAGAIKEELNWQGDIKLMDELVETDMGEFSGKDGAELRKIYGNLVDEWMFNPTRFRFPGGESYQELSARADRALDLLRDLNTELRGAFFVCSHVDVIKMMIVRTLGVSFDIRRSFIIPNGSVSVLGLSDKGNFGIGGLNIFP